MKPYRFTIVDLPKVADPRGNLSFIQGGGSVPFEIERCYWIYDVPGGFVRNGRALRHTTELIVALSGSFDVELDQGDGVKHTVHLCRGYKGVVVPPMCWRKIVDFSTNSVAMVLASSAYDPSEYIFDYDCFRSLVASRDEVSVIGESSSSELDAGIGGADNHGSSRLDDCGIVDLPRHLHTNGSLSVVENSSGSLFDLRRVFYLYDVPADSCRGGHSHHQASELIVAVSGSFDVTLDDGRENRTFTLDRPYRGLHITPGIWRTLQNFSGGAVCLVLTSEKYSEADYVRDPDEFAALTRHKTYDAVRYPFLDLKLSESSYIGELREAAMRVIESGRYIGGEEVRALEVRMCGLFGTSHCVGVGNGLDALRLIFKAYIDMGRLRPGDEVIVPANTYIASVLAVTDNFLTPVFVEPSEKTMNLDTSLVEKAITPRTRVIMPVHLYGRPCWDETLLEIVRRHDLIVVEDNAQAIGAEAICPGLYGSRYTGALGHAAAYSFYPTKNVGAAGDAGAVATNDPALAKAVAALGNYGSDYRYHNIYEGCNSRLDPIQATIINVKLSHLDEITQHRRAVAAVYSDKIDNPAVILPDRDPGAVWHQYVVRVANREGFRRYLAENGVQTDIHYAVPPHRQPCYARYANLHLPVTDRLAAEVVSLPISACTSVKDAEDISAIINRYNP